MTRAMTLLVAFGVAQQAVAQDAANPYPAMAPFDEYLMPDRAAEIELARSAAPDAISRDATILVLGRSGYETAVTGTNGFVCMVERGWTGAFDWPEFWNPRIRAAVCLNPQAARSILPIVRLRTTLMLAGRSSAEIVTAIASAFEKHELPELESGAMSYMMSKTAYLTDAGFNAPHLMFYMHGLDGSAWGSGAAGAPVLASPYWSFTPEGESRTKRLPPIVVFLVAVPDWSDGTAVDRGSPADDH